MKRTVGSNILTYGILLFGLALIILPLYLTIITAFKTTPEITKNFFSLPESFYLGNFKTILSNPHYPKIIFNTVFVTAASLLGIVIILPAASYAIARNMGSFKFYKYLYLFLLVGIFVPFQVKMMPLVKVVGKLNMMSVPGIVVIYIAASVCEVIFLYVAFISSIPTDLEESACIDGASTLRTYSNIIFPLLRPMTATVMIKDGLWLWNDFFLPLLILNKSPRNWTLTLFQYNFKSTVNIDYTLSFAAFFLSMLPIMLIYVVLQKHIIGGLTTGAIKG